MQVGGLTVRIRFDKTDAEVLEALGDLMHRLHHADPALLEDDIAAARDRLATALQLPEPFHLEAS